MSPHRLPDRPTAELAATHRPRAARPDAPSIPQAPRPFLNFFSHPQIRPKMWFGLHSGAKIGVLPGGGKSQILEFSTLGQFVRFIGYLLGSTPSAHTASTPIRDHYSFLLGVGASGSSPGLFRKVAIWITKSSLELLWQI